MPKSSIAVLSTTLQADTAASPGSIPMRDAGGGLTLGPSTVAGLTLTGALTQSSQSFTASGTILASADTVLANPTSAAITLILPPASTVANQSIRLIRQGTATQNVTYAPAGSDLMYSGGSSVSNYVQTTPAQNSITSDGVSWYVK